MIIFRYYDKENRIDRVWYDSSNIIYSECDDHVNALKTLRVVFKTGDIYEYENVDVNDYVMFMAGGEEGSNGKAFFKFIRSKYDGRKMGQVLLEELKQKMEEYKEIKKAEAVKEAETSQEQEEAEKNEKNEEKVK